jgi:DNA repair photolyase
MKPREHKPMSHEHPLFAPAPRALRARKGRGALSNRDGRYERVDHERIDDGWGSADEQPPPLPTTVTRDRSRTVIARNESPDIPFEQSLNPYRGCEHGCVYCYARPSHAYLGLSPGLDFESRLFAKPDAARLLEQELRDPAYRCKVLALGTNTDPYQPLERKLGITRRVLEVLAAYRHPVTIVTKSALVERDLDILVPMAARALVTVTLSVTTLDRRLARRMEPRATAPQRRLQTLQTLASAGVPTSVLVAPIIPGLNDAEIEAIVKACAQAGVRAADYVLLRLPWEIKELFEEWLDVHYPLKKARVLELVRQTRGGRLNDPRFGTRMTGAGAYAEIIGQRFRLICKQLGLNRNRQWPDSSQFRVSARAGDQLILFDQSE